MGPSSIDQDLVAFVFENDVPVDFLPAYNADSEGRGLVLAGMEDGSKGLGEGDLAWFG